MKKIGILLFLTLCSCTTLLAQKPSLQEEIQAILKGKKATVGIAAQVLGSQRSFSHLGKQHFPMQSVFKFHIALAVLHEVDKGTWQLHEPIAISRRQLLPNTWSPMRNDYPKGDTIRLSLAQIITYSAGQSDNNACDILLNLLGSPSKVADFLHKKGVKDLAIVASEAQMHEAWDVQFKNWTTPEAAIQTLKLFYEKRLLSAQSQDFLWKVMLESPTGAKRIKGLLPKGTKVAHKTGTSDRNAQGMASAVNDIGIVLLPNGKALAISIFVSNTQESDETNEQIIASVAKACYDYFSR